MGGGNFIRPSDNADIIRSMREGSWDTAERYMLERDMRLDQYFASFDLSQYTPTVTQGATTLTLNTAQTFVEGFRVGPWIQINAHLVINSAGAASTVVVTLPTNFPGYASLTGNSARVIGTFGVFDFGTTTWYVGAAQLTSSSGGSTMLGWGDAYASPFGIAGFVGALAANDAVAFSIQYQTRTPVS